MHSATWDARGGSSIPLPHPRSSLFCFLRPQPLRQAQRLGDSLISQLAGARIDWAIHLLPIGDSTMDSSTSSYWLIVEDDDADFFLLRRACERTIPRPPRIHREADGEQAER